MRLGSSPRFQADVRSAVLSSRVEQCCDSTWRPLPPCRRGEPRHSSGVSVPQADIPPRAHGRPLTCKLSVASRYPALAKELAKRSPKGPGRILLGECVDAHCALNAAEIALSATRRPVILVRAIGMSIATRSTAAPAMLSAFCSKSVASGGCPPIGGRLRHLRETQSKMNWLRVRCVFHFGFPKVQSRSNRFWSKPHLCQE